MFYWPFDPAVQTRGRWWRRGGPRSVGFASARGGGRLHAACDLVVPRGTEIRAIADGTVLDYRHFYEGTWALVVGHEHDGFQPFIVRYGEVLGPEGGIPWADGQPVRGGDVIARVGQLASGASMLHFELYATVQWPYPSLSIARRWHRAPESYTQEERSAIQSEGRWHYDFQRRTDLADPTDFLRALQQGRTPSEPIPYSRSSPGQVVQMEEMLVTPSDEFLREQALLRARQAQARRSAVMEEQLRQWYEEQGRLIRTDEMPFRGGARIPGPLDQGPARPHVGCQYYWYDRHGPM